MDEWYAFAAVLGAPRLVDGVVKRIKKVNDFVVNWRPLLESHVSELDKMSTETDKEREDKMLANLRGLKALKGKWRKPT